MNFDTATFQMSFVDASFSQPRSSSISVHPEQLMKMNTDVKFIDLWVWIQFEYNQF